MSRKELTERMAKQPGSFSTSKDDNRDADQREEFEPPSPDSIDY